MSTIALPAELHGLPLVLSISMGKDSTATALALREAGLTFRMVTADTEWEASEHDAQLAHLRETLGPIDVVRADGGGMLAQVSTRGFPLRTKRWCTRVLKLQPLKRYLQSVDDDAVSVVGVRAEESEARAKYAELVDDATLGHYLWRPILRWTTAEVIAIHHRHGVQVHPLYKRGHNRVGCYPCIHSNKEDLRLIAEHAPERIDLIRAAEVDGRTFFGRPIDEVVAWARTSRGGRQLPLLPAAPSGGCFQWGLCEAPSGES